MISDLKVYVSDTFLKCNKVILIPHNNPDFDAIGSAAGLTLIAKKLKKESKIIINDNLSMIDPGVKIIVDELNRESNLIIDKNKYVKEKNDNDLFVLTDVNKRNLISVNDLLNNNTLIIDHHNEDENTVKASYKYINTKMSSASEIVTKLISMLKIKIPSSIANYLLAGIYLDTNKLTKEGLRQYEDELHDLKVNRRQEIAQKIKEAREQGDLSENAEYDAAKDEQGKIEDRIAELEELLKNAEIISGTFVKAKDLETGETVEYKVVGSSQADSLNFMISDESPVGRALKESKKGETVKVDTPAGVLKFKIIDIWKD